VTGGIPRSFGTFTQVEGLLPVEGGSDAVWKNGFCRAVLRACQWAVSATAFSHYNTDPRKDEHAARC
jgi:hypothetical protein